MKDLLIDQIESPIGVILIACDGSALCALDFGEFDARMGTLLRRRHGAFNPTRKQDPLGVSKRVAAYLDGDLRAKLARYHDDVESAFWGWNDIWLHEPFRAWNIERELEAIRAPVLALQGVDDEYGTLEQIRRIVRRVPGAELLEIEGSGHSPHRDQPEAVIAAAVRFAGSR